MSPYLNILSISSEKPYYTKMRISSSVTFSYCTRFLLSSKYSLFQNSWNCTNRRSHERMYASR